MFNLNKKDNAETITNFALPLLTAVLVMVLIILFSTWMANINHMDTVNQIARKYILKMETTGGLTSEDELALRNELSEYCTNINFDGTSRKGDLGIEYGSVITLKISADLYAFNISIPNGDTGFISMENVNGDTNGNVILDTSNTTPITVIRSSTSKH